MSDICTNCSVYEISMFGKHLKKDCNSGMNTKCGYCGAIGHYSSLHKLPCIFCKKDDHDSRDHECSKCFMHGHHRALDCPLNKMTHKWVYGDVIKPTHLES